MNDVAHPAVRESEHVELRGFRERIPLLSLLRKDVASNGPAWLPLVLVLGAIGAVAYADHLVLSISLVYLYIFPLGVGAIFLQRELSYSLIAVCILFHDFFSPRNIGPGLRNLPQPVRDVVLRLCCLRHPTIYRPAGGAGHSG